MKHLRKTLIFILILGLIIIFSLPKGSAVNLVPLKDHNGDIISYRGNKGIVYTPSKYEAPERDLRAVWVSHYISDIEWSNKATYQQNYLAVLDKMEEYNLNTIFYHVRTHHDAIYDSTLNVRSSKLNNVDPNWDSLAWIIEETHKRGIEFHAWLNPYRIKSSGAGEIEDEARQYSDDNPASKPQNLLRSSSNGGLILNPGESEVREFLYDTVLEILDNYDVDGVHFDDYFYIADVDDSATMNKNNPNSLSKDDWRRKQVDTFISELSAIIRNYNLENNRYVQFGISPTGIYRNGYNTGAAGGVDNYDSNGNFITTGSNTAGQAHYEGYLYSDSKKWIDNEWIDYIIPQTYWALDHPVAGYPDIVDWWAKVVRYKDVNLYTGFGIYQSRDPRPGEQGGTDRFGWHRDPYEASKQVLYNTKHAAVMGLSIFAYQDISNPDSFTTNALEKIKTEYWTTKALRPVINTIKRNPLPVVNNALLTTENNQNVLTWDKLNHARGYVIYRSAGEIDFADNSQIIDIIGFDNHPIVTYIDKTSQVQNYNYGVRALDGANQLGVGTLIGEDTTPPSYNVVLQDNINNTLLKAEYNEAERGVINTIYPKSSANYEFMFWTQNGKVISTDTNYSFLTYRNEVFKGYLTKKDKLGIAFVNQNNDLIDFQMVDSVAELVIPTPIPPLDGYEFSHWSTPLEEITTHTIIKAIFTKSEKATFTINYYDGINWNSVEKKYASKFLLTPHDNFLNEFNYWIVNDKIYTYDELLNLTIYNDLTIKAVGGNKEAEPVIYIHDFAVASNDQVAFLGAYYLPDNFALLEAGIIIHPGETTKEFSFNTPGVLVKSADKISLTNEYAMILTDVIEGEVNMARMYLRFLNDESEEILLSNIITHTNISADYQYLLDIVSSIPKHITDDYTFPTAPGLSFSYLEGQDESLFNLATGELTKLRLTTQVRSIRAKIGNLYKDFEINFGVIGVEEQGSFYKNNPGHLSSYEGPADRLYGWSGYTITKDNKVHFITHAIELSGNGLITDETLLNHSSGLISLGTLYTNVGTETISFTVSSLDKWFENSSNYTKVIIGTNGEIKEIIKNEVNNNYLIHLSPGESLWSPKYNDKTDGLTFGGPNDFNSVDLLEINKYTVK